MEKEHQYGFLWIVIIVFRKWIIIFEQVKAEFRHKKKWMYIFTHGFDECKEFVHYSKRCFVLSHMVQKNRVVVEKRTLVNIIQGGEIVYVNLWLKWQNSSV